MAGNKDVVIRISATDAASPTFKRIAGEAKSMGAQVDEASATGERGMQRISKGAVAMGAAIGSATLLMGEFTRAAAEDEASQARVQQAIENTGKAYEEYGQQLDAVIKKGQEKAFSDDATRDALTRLVTATGDVDASMNQLGLAMDLARARGMDLGSAADLIGKVMNGNTSILKRYGIAVEDGATATEALAAIQQRTAGQADAYAQTTVGQLDIMKDKWGELTETIGAHAGGLQSILMLLPGLSAGYTALAGALSGLGGPGAMAGITALAAAGYYAYSLNQSGSGTENATAGFLASAAGLFGLNDVQSQFQGIVDSNNLSEVTNSAFYVPKGMASNASADQVAIMQLKNAGVLPWSFSGSMADAANYISAQAGQYGLSNANYIDRKIKASGSYTLDPVTGKYVFNDTYTALDQQRRLLGMPTVGANPGYGSMYAIAQGQANLPPTFNNAYRDQYFAAAGIQGGMARTQDLYNAQTNRAQAPAIEAAGVQVGMTAMSQQSVQIAENMTKALQAQYGAYAGLFDGVKSTNDALTAFQATQESLSTEMHTYQGQASEWNAELNAQDEAYKILQERQQNGVQLTKEQIQFLDQYAEAQATGTAAVEDATVAAGIAAQNMLLNKEAADSFKTSTDGLTEAINLLILSLDGVPEEIRTEVILDTDPAMRSLYDFLGLIPTSVTIPMYVSGQQINSFLGGGMDGMTVNAYAAGGTQIGGGVAMVGERGPEMVWLPNGAQVTNTEATKSRMGKRRGGGDIYNYGPITLTPQSANTYQELSATLMGGVR